MCFRPDAGSDDNGIEMNELAATSSLLPQVTTATNDSKEHEDNATNPTTSDQERTNTSNTITVDPTQHSDDQDDNKTNAKKEKSCCSVISELLPYMPNAGFVFNRICQSYEFMSSYKCHILL